MATVHRRSTAISLSVSFLTTIGAACTAIGTLKLTRFVWRHYLGRVLLRRRARNTAPLLARYGSGGSSNKATTTTAIVTGATSGLGRCCAMELARQGFDVVLIARTAVDLADLASLLRETYAVQVMTLALDASTATAQDIETRLIARLQQGEEEDGTVGILVNTLGIHNHRPCTVEDMDWELADRILAVNCRFPVLLTSLVIPLLKKNAKTHGHAAILNWGSLTSCTPMALLSTYAATKAWTLHWSRCLAAELQPQNIDVLCAQPGLTATPMSMAAGAAQPQAGGIVADPEIVAQNALSFLGVTQQKRVIPTPLHAFFAFLMENLLPESLQDSLNRSAGLEELKRMDTTTHPPPPPLPAEVSVQ